ncbi:MAG: alpha-1,6-mannanase [Bacteroidaceae bacterium]|nr:alpha-1,6-mannanase [Bacteroidaceae bacterium]
MKRYLLIVFAIASAAAAQAYSSTLAALVKNDYSTKADSLTHVLIEQFMNKTKGTFYSTPKDIEHSSQYIYWQQAHAIDVLAYGYERHKGDDTSLANAYRIYMQRWVTNKANNYSGGATGFENPFTDDMCWICLALLHISEVTGTKAYATTAKRLFDNAIIKRAKEDEETGGLWLPWNTDAGSGPNACTQSPACLAAAKLFILYEDSTYLDYAEKLYNYTIKKICKSDGRVEEPPLTYTQGTFGEACRMLFHITGRTTYKLNAGTYINYAFTNGRCTSNGLLRHEGTSMDQSLFKAVLIPYAANYCLDESMPLSTRRTIIVAMLKNADYLWKNLDKESYPAMFCPYYWGEAYDSSKTASMGAMASGASLMENVARMCIGLTTKPDDSSVQAPLLTRHPQADCIYTLGGRLVRSHTTDTRGLPAGIYIINNKKIAVH